MEPRRTQLETFVLILIAVIGVGWLMQVGAAIIKPIVLGIFFTVLASPVQNRIQSVVKVRWVSIITAWIVMLLPILVIAFLLSYQLAEIMDGLPSAGKVWVAQMDILLRRLEDALPFLTLDGGRLDVESIKEMLVNRYEITQTWIESTSSSLLTIVLSAIFTFFFLYYKESFYTFMVYRYHESRRDDVVAAIDSIQKTTRGYVVGMGFVIVILAVLNTLGLYLIGIDYALFWGVMAGLLAIIPFLGTFIGGLLPFLYALVTADYSWQPMAVAGYYILIQQVEGNIITPNVVGRQIDINALVAILALLIFGSIWGIVGVVIALPIVSVIRIIFHQFPSTRAYSVLMSSSLSDNSELIKRVVRRRFARRRKRRQDGEGQA